MLGIEFYFLLKSVDSYIESVILYYLSLRRTEQNLITSLSNKTF
jgi:hypothetical protein